MTALVVRGDARTLPLPNESVDLIVTSPPYFALRSYQDDGQHYAGQIGSEATPAEFLAALWTCTAEWIRVLKPTGSIFVNLGDKYSERAGPSWRGSSDRLTGRPDKPRRASSTAMAPRKSLLGMPWRYALGVVDELGLLLREDLIWSKPNGLPESVSDRARRSHEQWFHFTRREHYFAAVDEIREPHSGNAHNGRRDRSPAPFHDRIVSAGQRGGVMSSTDRALFDPRGRVPGSVWEIQSEPLSVPAISPLDGRPLPDHFAAFPTEWPRRLILGWSPAEICTACGEGRRPAAVTEQLGNGKTNSGRAKRQRNDQLGHDRGFNANGYPHTTRVTSIRGYVCACTPFIDYPERRRPSSTPKRGDLTHRPAAATGRSNDLPTPGLPVREYSLDDWDPASSRPAVVLDPCGGTGTVALVADVLGRIGITVDRSHDYSRLAAWRTTDPSERARALRVPKPPAQAAGQLDLLTPTATEEATP